MPLFWKGKKNLFWFYLLFKKITHVQHVCRQADIHLDIYTSGAKVNPKKVF